MHFPFTFAPRMRFITLLTDFGTKDASAAIAKSVLLLRNPDTEVLDITHRANGKYLSEAAYLLASSYQDFPVGTCHIVYVGVYHSKSPSLVLCEKNGHYFLAPNNGILPMALGVAELSLWQCYEWEDDTKTFRDWQIKCAEIARLLDSQQPSELGFSSFSLDPIKQKSMPAPVVTDTWADCQILHIADTGNIVLNMQFAQFEAMRNGRKFRIELPGRVGAITTTQKHLGMIGEGEMIARFNKAGYLEMALNMDNAAQMLGLNIYGDKQKFYSSIKIFFE